MEYQKAKAEVVLFDNSDVVMASDDCAKGGWANCDKNKHASGV